MPSLTKKRVCLSIGSNAQKLSVMVFFLKTNGFTVFAATCAEEAIALARDHRIEIVVAFDDIEDLGTVLQKIKALYPESHSILIRAAGDNHSENVADAQIVEPYSTTELLERLRIFSHRRRGRPGWRIQPRPS